MIRDLRPSLRAIARVAVLAALLFASRLARAQDKPTLNGSWTASALSESWSVSEWGEACGPKPAPQGAGGGSVQIREQGGELSIVGAGRAFSTAQCWEQMPGVARSSHSQSGGGRFWRTRCTSGANDSRRTAITTTISATDSSISLNETGDYTFTIKDQNCHASVSRSRSFSLVRRDGETPPAASASAAPTATATAAPAPPAPEPRAASKCSGGAGEPARIEVHPAKKLLRAGDKFTFKVSVLDADGCATGTRPTWLVAPGPLAAKAAVDATGTLSVAADAEEGKLEVNASVAGKGVTVHVEVASPEHYDALLGVSGLNDAGEADQAAVAVIATTSIGGKTVAAQDAARERKTTFVAIVAALAVCLAFAGLVVVRRGAKPAESIEGEGVPSERWPEGATSGPRSDPTSDLVPASSGGAAPSGRLGARVLADQASPGTLRSDPVDAPSPEAKTPAKPRGKICPTCGERYPNEAGFCGKDATKLVLIN